jgi:hypothetical protein
LRHPERSGIHPHQHDPLVPASPALEVALVGPPRVREWIVDERDRRSEAQALHATREFLTDFRQVHAPRTVADPPTPGDE